MKNIYLLYKVGSSKISMQFLSGPLITVHVLHKAWQQTCKSNISQKAPVSYHKCENIHLYLYP